jgi:predicted permease
MNALLQDLRYGLRMLVKSPGFTLVAVLALALGIGANTAIFSVVNAALLRPLPFKDPGRLVIIEEWDPKVIPTPIPVSAPDIADFRQQNHIFTDVSGFNLLGMDLASGGPPARITAARAGVGIFPLLGIPPLLGRTFTPEEDQPGRLVTILSYGLWQQRFAADPAIIGKTISLDRQPYSVVGIMPGSFEFPPRGMAGSLPVDVWVPLALTPFEISQRGDNFDFGVLARLKPGATLAAAQSDVAVIAQNVEQTYYPPQMRNEVHLIAVATSLQEKVVGSTRALLLLLLGAVALLLLIACANVSNLLLSRAAGRQKEIAVRVALGAGRLRLIRQLLSESILLSLLGGILGLLLAYWGTDLLVAAAPVTLPRAQEIGVDFRVLAFTFLLSLLTGLLFGLAPAFTASRTNLSEALKEGGWGLAGGRQRGRLLSTLVVAQVSLALVLVIGAGLLIHSFVRVLDADPGFRLQHVLTASIALSGSQYSKRSQVEGFYRQLIETLAGQPGVQAVSFSTDFPLNSGWTHIFTGEGHLPARGAPLQLNYHSVVLGNYFQALDIPLKAGRYLTDEDGKNGAQVVIISEGMARRYWPGENPVGKRLKWGLPEADNPWLTIVGIVGDIKQGPLDKPTAPHTYEPYSQLGEGIASPLGRSLHLIVRAAMDPASLASNVRNVVQRIDAEQPVADVQALDEVLSASVAPRRFIMTLLAIFAAAALLLAAIGMYGVLAYGVTRRMHEIGIRLALGAQPRNIFSLVIGHGMRLMLLGIVIGLAGAFALTRLMASLLFGVSATDPATFAGVVLLLALVALVACYLPAHRAMRVDPMRALRYE